MPKKPELLRFDINAAVVFRLGEELITDDVQALVELIKNCYDADATWVKVTIDSSGRNDSGRHYAAAEGTIVVDDNGHGIDEDAIRAGWMTIANSPKRDQKNAGRATRRGRTPIGDKGLGRLGSQRLAQNVEVFTRAQAAPEVEHYIAFSWADFRERSRLGDVPVQSAQTRGRDGTPGTRLVLSGLRDAEVWQASDKVRELQRRLSAMISPFEEVSDFHVHLEVDGKHLELAEIHRRLRDTAQLRYSFEFDGERLWVRGLARLSYFRPGGRSDQKLLETITRRDKGRALFEYLAARTGRGRPSQLSRSGRRGWFVAFSHDRALDDLPGVRRADGSAVGPGPFRGEIDAVSLESPDARSAGFGRVSEYRQLVRDLAGIRVYRDGFGIRVGEDWLELGRQWTGGGSYYGLRPGNVLGFVKISARDNPDLVETTSREGFQETPHYENFLELLREFVRFAGDTQEFLRRGAVDFVKQYRDREAGVDPDDDHSSLTRRIGDVAGRLTSHRKVVERQVGSLRKAADGAAKTLGDVRGELKHIALEDTTVSRAIVELEGEIEKVTTVGEGIRKRDDGCAQPGIGTEGDAGSPRSAMDDARGTYERALRKRQPRADGGSPVARDQQHCGPARAAKCGRTPGGWEGAPTGDSGDLHRRGPVKRGSNAQAARPPHAVATVPAGTPGADPVDGVSQGVGRILQGEAGGERDRDGPAGTGAQPRRQHEQRQADAGIRQPYSERRVLAQGSDSGQGDTSG